MHQEDFKQSVRDTLLQFHEGIAALTAFNETTTPLNDTSIEHSIYWLNAGKAKVEP